MQHHHSTEAVKAFEKDPYDMLYFSLPPQLDIHKSYFHISDLEVIIQFFKMSA